MLKRSREVQHCKSVPALVVLTHLLPLTCMDCSTNRDSRIIT